MSRRLGGLLSNGARRTRHRMLPCPLTRHSIVARPVMEPLLGLSVSAHVSAMCRMGIGKRHPGRGSDRLLTALHRVPGVRLHQQVVDQNHDLATRELPKLLDALILDQVVHTHCPLVLPVPCS